MTVPDWPQGVFMEFIFDLWFVPYSELKQNLLASYKKVQRSIWRIFFFLTKFGLRLCTSWIICLEWVFECRLSCSQTAAAKLSLEHQSSRFFWMKETKPRHQCSILLFSSILGAVDFSFFPVSDLFPVEVQRLLLRLLWSGAFSQ